MRHFISHNMLWTIAIAAGIFGTVDGLYAQSYRNLQTPETPLVLKAQGSFFVGGERVRQTRAELGDFLPDGHITINQMYVRFMIPQQSEGHLPVVMIHGMALTGNSWETTPDGRMGWDEYFVRKGHPTFIVDQVGRGRSGFDQSIFNRIRSGLVPPDKLPPVRRFTDESFWPNFRFGPKENTPYSDTLFPFAFAGEASKQSVPDLNSNLANPNPNFKVLAELARQLDGAVLMSHSQSGAYPIEAALIDSSNIRALVMVEPGGIPESYTDEQVRKLAKLPILFIFGDHIGEASEGTGHSWKQARDSAYAFLKRIKTAGGNAEMFDLPAMEIRGNSHMIMQDKNNLAIADMILKWIDENVDKGKN